uniref:hypothetical protein n=1 Tax=Polynucleobacter sp. TaxID=2029855 RepID=UPI004048B203
TSRRPYRKTIRKRSKVSTKIKKYVKRQIHKNIENKVVSINQTLAFGNYLESPDLNLYPVLPYSGFTSISQGVSSGSRLANRCKVMKVILKYVLFPKGYDAITNTSPTPCEVQMFLLNLKQATGVLPTPTQLTGLVQLGATSTALQGNLADIAVNSWNKDVFNVKTWTHKVGFSIADGTGSYANNQFFANNDFKLNVVRRMDITKMVASEMRFDDNGSTHLGKNVFFGFQAVSALGGTFGSSVLPVQIQYWIDIIYEDA